MPCVVDVEDVELGDKAKFRQRGLRNDHFLEALVNRDSAVTKERDNTVTAHSPQGKGYKYMKIHHMAGSNPFVSAVHLAFAEHLPLRITPDLVFLIIIQACQLMWHKILSATVLHWCPMKAHKTFCSSSQRAGLLKQTGRLLLHPLLALSLMLCLVSPPRQ
jgi:hypothetical protein